ncbi:MAG: hypothetical protein V4506_03475 [Bacteroidota bacterium]
MLKRTLQLIGIISFFNTPVFSQTGIGIGLYPTGTETGFGIRTSKETRLAGDFRIARASVFNEKSKTSSFVTEVSGIYRVVKLEKVRFHVGLGYRADWNLNEHHKHGVIVPVGVEAFPFPFQNAGLFFEAAPFYVSDFQSHPKDNAGIRTAAGFVFYFPVKNKSNTVTTPTIKP